MANTWFNKDVYLANKLKAWNATSQGAGKSLADLEAAILAEGLTAETHFEQFGAAEGLSPNEFFNIEEYKAAQVLYLNKRDNVTTWTADSFVKTVEQHGMTLWSHYQKFGWNEVNPSLSFDTEKYFQAKLVQLKTSDDLAIRELWADKGMADVKQAFVDGGIDPVSHYFAFGKAEGVAVQPAQKLVYELTINQDKLVGYTTDDTFAAKVVQNADGAQTNQLATGDYIDGGAGTDTLSAVVQAASALNAGPGSAIAVQTVDVEVANFTALGAKTSSDNVVINAKFMNGLDKVASVHSDVDLIVENLNTLTDNGVYADRRNTDSLTVSFDHGGNDAAPGTSNGTAADMVALIDNDYLFSGSTSSSAIELFMVNALALADDDQPLKNIEMVSFKVGAMDVVVKITTETQALARDAAYAAVVDAINTELAALNLSNVSAKLGGDRKVVFSDDVGDYKLGDTAGRYFPIVVEAKDTVLSTGETKIDSTAGRFNGLFDQEANVNPTTQNLVAVNVELHKVGRGGEGGELIVGGMATDMKNNFKFTDNAQKEGVEAFNVTVKGDHTQFSSLAGLYSTNNTLQEVNVKWEKDSVADLIIGNHNTDENRSYEQDFVSNTAGNSEFNSVTTGYNTALKDVRVFNAQNNNAADAKGNKADVTVHAHLSDEVVAKYLDRKDTQDNAAADNKEFAYTFGDGNDTLNLNISKSNLAATGLAERDDFVLKVATGAGDDKVITQIGNGQSGGNWDINEALTKNLSIDTGDGADLVHVNGAGAWDIKTGTGNDVVYSDNSGRQEVDGAGSNAVWVFNTAEQTQGAVQVLDDLESATAVAAVNEVTGLSVTVTLRGVAQSVTVEGNVSDLTINQAIKKAISTSDYLKNLLTAEDGPGRTLVVTSKVDGEFSDTDLSVSLSGSALSADQMSALGFGADGKALTDGRFDSAIAEVDDGAVESATVNWAAFTAATEGTLTVAGLTITSDGTAAFTAANIATVVNRGTVAGLTVTGELAGWKLTDTVQGTSTFERTVNGNVANLTVAVSGSAAAPRISTQDGSNNEIKGADSAQTNANVIDAGLGNDTVVLSSSANAGEVVNVAATDGTSSNDSDVVFNATNATITVDVWDKVVTSAGVTVQNAAGAVKVKENTVTGTAGDDTIDASAANAGPGQTLDGQAGNDTITGSSFNDTITGGAGSDTLKGGAGDDTFVIAAAADFTTTEVIDGGAGTDVIEFKATAAETLTLTSNVTSVEEVEITAAAGVAAGVDASALTTEITLTGNAANNALTGSATAASTINGGAGNDTITGGAAADTLNGEAGDDTINGGAGADTITGGAGADTLNGGEGNDTFVIATAAEFAPGEKINGGVGGTDVIDFATADAETLTLTADVTEVEEVRITSANAAASVNAAALAAAITLIGNAGDNALTGSATAASIINGGAGNDTITGGAVADTLDGGDGNDVFIIAAAADHATGETINGGNGNDTIRFTSTTGQTLDLQAGVTVETVVIANADGVVAGTTAENVDATAVTTAINLTGNAGNNALTGSATAASTINGGAGNDTITGGAVADTLHGEDGDDNIDGGAGNDTITGGAGADTLNGEDGDDNIDGGSGDDIINGGAGDDTINGGVGADEMTGDAGADTFVFAAGDSGTISDTVFDIVSDYTAAAAGGDKLDLVGAADAEADTTAAMDVSAAISGGAGTEDVDASIEDGVITLSGAEANEISDLTEWLAVARLMITSDTKVGAFEFDGDTYVYQENTDGDLLIQLDGVTGITAVGVAAAADTIFVG